MRSSSVFNFWWMVTNPELGHSQGLVAGPWWRAKLCHCVQSTSAALAIFAGFLETQSHSLLEIFRIHNMETGPIEWPADVRLPFKIAETRCHLVAVDSPALCSGKAKGKVHTASLPATRSPLSKTFSRHQRWGQNEAIVLINSSFNAASGDGAACLV